MKNPTPIRITDIPFDGRDLTRTKPPAKRIDQHLANLRRSYGPTVRYVGWFKDYGLRFEYEANAAEAYIERQRTEEDRLIDWINQR